MELDRNKDIERKPKFPSRKKVQQFLDFENEALDQEISFEAITTGLGFGTKKERQEQEVRQPKNFPRVIITKENLEKARPENINTENIHDDLKFFYQSESERENTSTDHLEELHLETNTANFRSRLIAYILDLSFISVISLSSLAILNVFLSWVVDETILALNTESLIIGGFFFSFFYISYFSISERLDHSTPGKRLMNLELKGNSSENISLTQTLTRSILSYIGVFTLGLPALLGIDRFLSNTSVIKK